MNFKTIIALAGFLLFFLAFMYVIIYIGKKIKAAGKKRKNKNLD
jgi:F0F1-type ATP synthase membrane subunit b/b'